MSYKRVVEKKGKIYGPYFYESYRDKDGNVRKRYLGKPEGKKGKKIIFSLLIIFLILLFSVVIFDNNYSELFVGNSVSGAVISTIGFFPQFLGIFLLEGIVSEIVENSGGLIDDIVEVIVDEEEIEESDEDAAYEIVEENNETEEIEETNETLEEEQNETSLADDNVTISNETVETNESLIVEEDGGEGQDVVEAEEEIEEQVVNETEDEAIVNVETKKARIVIGRPVKWIKKIVVKNAIKNTNLSLELPKKAENIVIKTGREIEEAEKEFEDYAILIEEVDRKEIVKGVTGLVSFDVENQESWLEKFFNWFMGLFGITGRVIEEAEMQENIIDTDEARIVEVNDIVNLEQEQEVVVEYYTEAPRADETEIESGKRIIITGPDEVEYEDVLAYSLLDNFVSVEELEKIRFYHIVDGVREKKSFEAYDLDEDGYVDYIEWNVEHLSEQIYEIIYITKAVRLNADREFISDIYEEVRELDSVWSEEIGIGEYVRVVFERNLDNTKDITLYARGVNGTARVEVYVEDGVELVAVFEEILGEGEYKVYLTDLVGTYDTFDLRVLNAGVEFDYIVDPPAYDVTTVYRCGEIDVAGVYTVNQSINATGTCLTITVDDVIINGKGYSITGDNTGTYYGINNTGSLVNITIKDFGNINNFTRGIYFKKVNNSLIINNTMSSTIAQDTDAIYLENVNSSSIENNTIKWNATGAGNLPSGIYIYVSLGSYGNNNITGNNLTITSAGHSAHGILFSNWGSSMDSNTIQNNTIDVDGGGPSALTKAVGIYLFNFRPSMDSNTIKNNTIDVDGSFFTYGILLENFGTSMDSNTIYSNAIDIDGSSSASGASASYGIYVAQTGSSMDSNIIQSNTIDVNGSSYVYGLWVGSTYFPMSSTIIYNQTIDVSSTGSGSAFLAVGISMAGGSGVASSNFSNFSLLTINATAPNAWAADISFSGNDNVFADLNLSGTNWSVRAGGTNNTFTNVSYLGEEYVGASANLTRKWYYKAYVDDSDGNPVSGVNFSIYAVSAINALINNLTTAATGWTNQTTLIDYINVGGTKTYYSNYSIVAFNASDTDTNPHNVTLERNILNDIFTIEADNSAPTISNHQVHVGWDSAIVSWVINEAGNASIKYGATGALEIGMQNISYAAAPLFELTGMTGNTTHYYNITSCDVIQNCVTEQGSFITEAAPDSSQGGEGSVSTFYNLATSALRKGVTKFLKKGNKINLYFPHIGQHVLRVDAVTETSATITISSSPITVTLLVGETKTLDLDEDGVDDLKVSLISISNGIAKFDIEGLNLPKEDGEDKKEEKDFVAEKEKEAESGGCEMDVECLDWNVCEVSYGFRDLIEGVEKIDGEQRRLCEDKNSCVSSYYESRECSVALDIYAIEDLWCEEEVIKIYEKETDEFVGIINDRRFEKVPSMDILFLDSEEMICDYCFNEVQDGDEEGVDCGGSCLGCVDEDFSLNWFEKLMKRLGF